MIVRTQPGATISYTFETPIGATGPITWLIIAPDSSIIIQGTATRSVSGVYTAAINIPTNLPIYNPGVQFTNWYRLEFTLNDAVFGQRISSEYFEIVLDLDPAHSPATTDIVIMGGIVVDNLYNWDSSAIVTWSLQDAAGTIITTAIPVWVPATQSWKVSVSGVNIVASLNMYLSIWVVSGGTRSDTEVHPAYSAPNNLLVAALSIGKLIDRARMGDAHNYLSYSPADLLHFTLRGLFRIISEPPNVTPIINPANIPFALDNWVIKCGAVEALRSQLLAEGLSAFNFSGAGTTLEVDRTAPIQNLLDHIEQEVQQGLRSTKSALIRSGWPNMDGGGFQSSAAGVLVVSGGSYTSIPFDFNVYSSGLFSTWGQWGGWGSLLSS